MLPRRLFRALVALAALVAVAGAVTPGVAGVVSPRYRVWRALPLEGVVSGIDLTPPGGWGSDDLVARRMTGLDPWGRPWSIVRASSANVWTRGPLVVTSAGPDGVDEGGAGDDVRLDGDMERVAVAPQGGVLAALALLWLALALRSALGPRGPEAWHDLARAGAAASPAAALLALEVDRGGAPLALGEGVALAVPVPVAVVGAGWLVLTLALLGWRVRPSNPRRRRVRAGRVALAVGLWGLALVTTWDALRRHVVDARLRADECMARLGLRSSIEARLRGDLVDLEAYLAQDPQVEWQRVRGLEGVVRLGPARALPILAQALRWDGGVYPLQVYPWRYLLAHDVQLRSLATALAAEPDRFPALLLGHTELSAALVGQGRALEGLALLEGRRASEPTILSPGLVEPDAAETRRRAGEASARLRASGGEDAWVVVDVLGATPVDGELACATSLDAGPEREWRAPTGDGRVMAVVGPLPDTPAGRVLRVRDLAGRRGELELPALPAGTTTWVDALVRSGRLEARRIARPR